MAPTTWGGAIPWLCCPTVVGVGAGGRGSKVAKPSLVPSSTLVPAVVIPTAVVVPAPRGVVAAGPLGLPAAVDFPSLVGIFFVRSGDVLANIGVESVVVQHLVPLGALHLQGVCHPGVEVPPDESAVVGV